ncbi:MAG: hypothetical protein PHX02_07400 [Oscillospiraceae bacterium]|nr:hypothetical protein [Oscillospiraceae bacterium]
MQSKNINTTRFLKYMVFTIFAFILTFNTVAKHAKGAAPKSDKTIECLVNKNMAPGDTVSNNIPLNLQHQNIPILTITCDDDFFQNAFHTSKLLKLKVTISFSNDSETLFDGYFNDFVKNGIHYVFLNSNIKSAPVQLNFTATLPIDASNDMQGETMSGNFYININVKKDSDFSPVTSVDMPSVFASMAIAGISMLLSVITGSKFLKR